MSSSPDAEAGFYEYQSYLPKASTSELISVISPVDYGLDTLLSTPRPLVGIVLQNSFSSRIQEEYSAFQPLNVYNFESKLIKSMPNLLKGVYRSMGVPSTGLQPIHFPKPLNLDLSSTQGIFRYDWIFKHTHVSPGVVLFVLEYLHDISYEEQEQEWSTLLRTFLQLNQGNTNLASRMLVVLVYPNHIKSSLVLNATSMEEELPLPLSPGMNIGTTPPGMKNPNTVHLNLANGGGNPSTGTPNITPLPSPANPGGNLTTIPPRMERTGSNGGTTQKPTTTTATKVPLEQHLKNKFFNSMDKLKIEKKRCFLMPVALEEGTPPPPSPCCLAQCEITLPAAYITALESILSTTITESYYQLVKQYRKSAAQLEKQVHPVVKLQCLLKAGWICEMSAQYSLASQCYQDCVALLFDLAQGDYDHVQSVQCLLACIKDGPRESKSVWPASLLLQARAISMFVTIRGSIASVRCGKSEVSSMFFAKHYRLLNLYLPTTYLIIHTCQLTLSRVAQANIYSEIANTPNTTANHSGKIENQFFAAASTSEMRQHLIAMFGIQYGLLTQAERQQGDFFISSQGSIQTVAPSVMTRIQNTTWPQFLGCSPIVAKPYNTILVTAESIQLEANRVLDQVPTASPIDIMNVNFLNSLYVLVGAYSSVHASPMMCTSTLYQVSVDKMEESEANSTLLSLSYSGNARCQLCVGRIGTAVSLVLRSIKHMKAQNKNTLWTAVWSVAMNQGFAVREDNTQRFPTHTEVEKYTKGVDADGLGTMLVNMLDQTDVLHELLSRYLVCDDKAPTCMSVILIHFIAYHDMLSGLVEKYLPEYEITPLKPIPSCKSFLSFQTAFITSDMQIKQNSLVPIDVTLQATPALVESIQYGHLLFNEPSSTAITLTNTTKDHPETPATCMNFIQHNNVRLDYECNAAAAMLTVEKIKLSISKVPLLYVSSTATLYPELHNIVVPKVSLDCITQDSPLYIEVTPVPSIRSTLPAQNYSSKVVYSTPSITVLPDLPIVTIAFHENTPTSLYKGGYKVLHVTISSSENIAQCIIKVTTPGTLPPQLYLNTTQGPINIVPTTFQTLSPITSLVASTSEESEASLPMASLPANIPASKTSISFQVNNTETLLYVQNLEKNTPQEFQFILGVPLQSEKTTIMLACEDVNIACTPVSRTFVSLAPFTIDYHLHFPHFTPALQLFKQCMPTTVFPANTYLLPQKQVTMDTKLACHCDGIVHRITYVPASNVKTTKPQSEIVDSPVNHNIISTSFPLIAGKNDTTALLSVLDLGYIEVEYTSSFTPILRNKCLLPLKPTISFQRLPLEVTISIDQKLKMGQEGFLNIYMKNNCPNSIAIYFNTKQQKPNEVATIVSKLKTSNIYTPISFGKNVEETHSLRENASVQYKVPYTSNIAGYVKVPSFILAIAMSGTENTLVPICHQQNLPSVWIE